MLGFVKYDVVRSGFKFDKMYGHLKVAIDSLSGVKFCLYLLNYRVTMGLRFNLEKKSSLE